MRSGGAYGHTFALQEELGRAGGHRADGEGDHRGDDSAVPRSDAVLFGAVGGAGIGRPDAKVQPEYALFRLRKSWNSSPICAQCALCRR